MKKYELTSETKVVFGRTLYRIRALASFSIVSAGDLGGFVETEENLDQSGNAWVYGDAQVSGNARVCGNAWVGVNAHVFGDALVCGNAQVYGNARVFGDALVCGNAWVYGNARVYGDARVYGNARVYGDAWVYGDARVGSNAQVCGDAQKTPIHISGLTWPVTILDTHMHIGCEFHSLDDWRGFDDARIARMDGRKALKFWRAHRDFLLGIAAADGRGIKKEEAA